eukprot:gene12998-14336_t
MDKELVRTRNVLPCNKNVDQNGLESSHSKGESDEYDLDDFQLLLERHRLIQQQLSAIGKQEKDLEEKIASNEYFDEFTDFQLTPNPNVIEAESEELPIPGIEWVYVPDSKATKTSSGLTQAEQFESVGNEDQYKSDKQSSVTDEEQLKLATQEEEEHKTAMLEKIDSEVSLQSLIAAEQELLKAIALEEQARTVTNVQIGTKASDHSRSLCSDQPKPPITVNSQSTGNNKSWTITHHDVRTISEEPQKPVSLFLNSSDSKHKDDCNSHLEDSSGLINVNAVKQDDGSYENDGITINSNIEIHDDCGNTRIVEAVSQKNVDLGLDGVDQERVAVTDIRTIVMQGSEPTGGSKNATTETNEEKQNDQALLAPRKRTRRRRRKSKFKKANPSIAIIQKATSDLKATQATHQQSNFEFPLNSQQMTGVQEKQNPDPGSPIWSKQDDIVNNGVGREAAGLAAIEVAVNLSKMNEVLIDRVAEKHDSGNKQCIVSTDDCSCKDGATSISMQSSSGDVVALDVDGAQDMDVEVVCSTEEDAKSTGADVGGAESAVTANAVEEIAMSADKRDESEETALVSELSHTAEIASITGVNPAKRSAASYFDDEAEKSSEMLTTEASAASEVAGSSEKNTGQPNAEPNRKAITFVVNWRKRPLNLNVAATLSGDAFNAADSEDETDDGRGGKDKDESTTNTDSEKRKRGVEDLQMRRKDSNKGTKENLAKRRTEDAQGKGKEDEMRTRKEVGMGGKEKGESARNTDNEKRKGEVEALQMRRKDSNKGTKENLAKRRTEDAQGKGKEDQMRMRKEDVHSRRKDELRRKKEGEQERRKVDEQERRKEDEQERRKENEMKRNDSSERREEHEMKRRKEDALKRGKSDIQGRKKDELKGQKKENLEQGMVGEVKGKLLQEEEHEDDIALRGLLLESLATKRAEKAKAIIANQVSKASIPVPLANTISQPALHRAKSDSLITRHIKLPVAEPAFSQQSEKVIIQIGNDSDTEEEDESSQNDVEAARPSSLSSAINDLLREARHGTKVTTTDSTTEKSFIPPKTNDNEVARKASESSAQNALLLEHLQKGIQNAHTKLDSQRTEAKKDAAEMKSLLKKISVRKLKIEQQGTKITKLKEVLAKIENAQKTLTSQCGVFESQVKALSSRNSLRTEKIGALEEELLRARSIQSAAKKRDASFRDSSDRGSAPSSPSQGSSSMPMLTDNSEYCASLTEQLKRSIKAANLALMRKSEDLASAARVSVTRSRLPSKRKLKPSEKDKVEHVKKSKAANVINKTMPSKGDISSRSELVNTKEKLQKLEKELRDKLERMKALSASKLNQKSHEKKVVRKVYRSSGPQVGGQDVSAKGNSDGDGYASVESRDGVETNVANAYKGDQVGCLATGDKSIVVFNGKEFASSLIERNDSTRPLQEGLQTDGEHLANEGTGVCENSKIAGNAITVIRTVLEDLFKDSARLEKIKEQQLQEEAKVPCYVDALLSDNTRGGPTVSRVRLTDHEFAVIESAVFDGMKLEPGIGEGRNGKLWNDHQQRLVKKTLDECRKYTSPLLHFRSYRLCPYFRTREKKSLQSCTYSNKINPRSRLCRYDLTGKCLDETCKAQHITSALNLSDDELLKDLLLYEPMLAGIAQDDAAEAANTKIHNFIVKLRKQCKNAMSKEQLALVLIGKIKDFRREKSTERGFVLCPDVEMRRRLLFGGEEEEQSVGVITEYRKKVWSLDRSMKKHQRVQSFEIQEVRYFEEDYDIRRSLEKTLEDNPQDVSSWISLAKRILLSKGNDTSHTEEEEIENKALNVLSRALEANPTSEILWLTYLDLYCQNRDMEDIRELCMQAIEYCPSYNTWCKFLQLERKQKDKIEICLDIINFLVQNSDTPSKDSNMETTEIKSHRIFETLLYMVQLEMANGNISSAGDILLKALTAPSETSTAEQRLFGVYNELSMTDMVTLWLVRVSVAACGRLPCALFDPCDARPSKVVSKNIVGLNWTNQSLEVESVRQIFKDGLSSIESHAGFTRQNITSLVAYFETWLDFEVEQGSANNCLDAIRTFSQRWKASGSLMLLFLKAMTKVSKPTVVVLFVESDETCYMHGQAKTRCEYSRQFSFEEIQTVIDRSTAAQQISQSREDTLHLYRRLLNISTASTAILPLIAEETKVNNKSREYAFLWLNYCLLLDLVEMDSKKVEQAFEIAVNSYTTLQNRKLLWRQYLKFSSKNLSSSDLSLKYASMKNLLNNTRRCLACIPSSTPLPYDSNQYYNDFSFHNSVIVNCLDILPKSGLGTFLEENLKMMPLNVALAIRTCHFEMENGNAEQARDLYGFVLKIFPYSLEMWRMSIWVEMKCGAVREARWLYKEATKNLPHCMALWKDRLLFELAHGSSLEAIETSVLEVVKQGNDYGMDIENIVKEILRDDGKRR